MADRNTFPGPVPKEALAFFRAKGWRIGFDHRDVWREEHATAFTVAKAMEMDVLEAIRGAVDNTLSEGMTFREFSRQLTPLLQRLGWWGVQEMTDPLTGETREVQLGSPRRLRTIYNANLRTARAAGQWARAERTKTTHPYLLYLLGPSREHRPDHQSWHGTLLPVDDPWWQTHSPPNGYGCKCHVRQVSRREYERLQQTGLQDATAPQAIDPATGRRVRRAVPVRTTAPPVRYRTWVNKRTGEVERVPEGIDPGWDTNPGQLGRLAQALDQFAAKANAVAPAIAVASVRDMVRSAAFAAWYAQPEGRFPLARMPDDHAQAIGARVRVVQFSADSARKQRQQHPELAAEEYRWVQEAIDRGARIQDGPRSLIYLLDIDGYMAVVKATATGKNLFLTSFRRISRDEVKRSEEIRRLRRKGERFKEGKE